MHAPISLTDGVHTILGWPREGLDQLPALLVAGTEELGSYGLLDPQGRLTDLGARLAYHAAEAKVQDKVYATGLHPLMKLAPGSRWLDIGCGSGQTLRCLASAQSQEIQLTGLDSDLEMLAMGARLATLPQADPIHYWHGQAEALPFEDNSFSHIIHRVVLPYTHQWRALSEAARVLAPGGKLYLQAEGLGYDLLRLRAARNRRACRECLLQTLLATLWACTPWQPQPGSRRWLPWRAYTPCWRLRRTLKRLGFRVLAWEPTQLIYGMAKSTIVVAESG